MLYGILSGNPYNNFLLWPANCQNLCFYRSAQTWWSVNYVHLSLAVLASTRLFTYVLSFSHFVSAFYHLNQMIFHWSLIDKDCMHSNLRNWICRYSWALKCHIPFRNLVCVHHTSRSGIKWRVNIEDLRCLITLLICTDLPQSHWADKLQIWRRGSCKKKCVYFSLDITSLLEELEHCVERTVLPTWSAVCSDCVSGLALIWCFSSLTDYSEH